MVRILIYPIGGGLPLTVDLAGPDALADALVLDLRPTDAENVLKGGATEYSFDAPQTPSNRAIFDDWQHYQRDAGTAYLYRDAVLEVNGFPARLGKIALMSTTEDVARLTMFFDSEDPFRNLQDLKVNELNWDVVPDTDMGLLVRGGFPLLQPDFFNGGKNVVTIPAKLRSWPLEGTDRVVTNADFYPCISVKSLFYQAFQRTTPTAPASIDGISQFTNNRIFKNLVLFVNKNRGYNKAYLENLLGANVGSDPFTATFYEVPPGSQVYVPMDFLTIETGPGFYDNGNNYTSGPGVSQYVAPVSGIYTFEFTATCGPNMPTGGVFPFENGSIYFRVLVNAVPAAVGFTPNFPDGQTTTQTIRTSFPATVGDVLDFECAFVAFRFVVGGTQLGDIQSISMRISMASDSYSAGSTPLLTGGMIPDNWTVADVMRDVFRMFNLRMFWDNVRQTLAIAPARRWYNQLDGQTYSGFMAQPEVDWTDRVVEPPQEVIVERWAWDYWTVYGEPADAWLKAQSALSEVPSAGGRINAGRYGSQRNQVEIEGKAMAHIFDATVSDPLYPAVMLPMLLREDHTLDPIGQTSFNEDDSLFYLMVSNRTTAAEYGRLRVYDIPTTASSLLTTCQASQIPYDWNSQINTLTRPSLAFGDEASANGNPIPGLLSNYHFGTITSANNGKYMKAQIRLSSVDLQTYTFDRPVRISSRLFEVLRINGKPAESDVYEVELRTIDYPDAAALSWLQNPNTPSYLTYDADPE